jgi:hypothetical protein
MDYQREKDRRLYKNARIAQENAHLSIIKQGEVVQVLSKLSGVLRTGLFMILDSKNSTMLEAAPNVLLANPNLEDCTSAPWKL